jgi:selenocysteine-specific elongation factor
VSEAASLTVGTAGHIDHGKTALVRALTGRDTDRLAEERRRGMSIELGYAELAVGGRRLSLVDVPGHERLVRTMIAGATGIDLFLLVVAADDGVMPQTREHLAVLEALGIEAGVVALTKIDLAEDGQREAAAAEIAELLPGAPVVALSARSGEGIQALRERLAALAEEVSVSRSSEPEDDPPVLHVDRCFTIAGHGTVVTGTLWTGALSRGDQVILLPGGATARVRAIESHDHPQETVGPRRRVALNLAGIGREEVGRGDVVTVAGAPISSTYRLDVTIESGAAAILGERRVQVHHGTREAPARVVDLGNRQVQLRLEQPLLARRGDRLVVRRIAPPDTLGGAVVTDPAPRRHGPGAPAEHPPDAAQEEARVDPTPASPPAVPGPLARRLLAELEADGERPRTPAKLAEDAGLERRGVERALGDLVEAGAAVRFKADVVYPTAEGNRLAAAVQALAVRDGSTSIGEVRDALGLSRKYAQAVLEHLDGERILRRDGDRHYPRGVAPLS